MPPEAASETANATSVATDTARLLIRLAAARDDRAWEALIIRHAAAMRRAAQAVAGRTELADDAVQEALLQVRDRARLFRPTGADPERSAVAWLRRIAATCALQLLRSERRRTRHERAVEDATVRLPPPLPLEALSEAELRTAVMSELAALPEREREPIVLHLLVGLDHATIGARIGCSAGAARVRLHRAIERLRQRLSTRQGIRGVDLTALVASFGDGPPSAERLERWRSLLTSSARPRLSRMAVFGGSHWLRHSLLLCLLIISGRMLLWSADEAAPSARVAATPQPTGSHVVVDDAVTRAIDARIALVLNRDTVLDTMRFIDAQLPPGAEIWWRLPGALEQSGALLISGEPHSTLRDFLNALEVQHRLSWEARGDSVILWQPASKDVAARLSAALEGARQRHDAGAWATAADEILAGGDVLLRRAIVRTVSDADTAVAAQARAAALRIGGERVAAEFSGDGPAGAALVTWMHGDAETLRDARFWCLWADLRPRDGFPHCLRLIDTALKAMEGSNRDGARRILALALPAAALTASASQLPEVALRVGRSRDLDVAIEALCMLARRRQPQAVVACQQLATGTVDHVQWASWTDRQGDAKQALLVLRERPSLALLPGWWHEDVRFGEHGVVDDLRACPFDPLYQEPAIEALVAIRDQQELGRLARIADGIGREPLEPSLFIDVPGAGKRPMRTSDQLRRDCSEEQALQWLAAARQPIDPARLLDLVDRYQCFDLDGAGSPDLLLRLVRAGLHLSADDQRRLDHGLFAQAQSLGGMMPVGTPNRYLPWLAHFDGLEDPALIQSIVAELARPDYRAIWAVGGMGGQYGFPIYQRLAQSLATMRTPAALTALRGARPNWSQQPEAGLSYWYLALGYAHDADATQLLLHEAQGGGQWSGYAVAALAATRDPAALAMEVKLLPALTGMQHGWCAMNLAQDGMEWAPQQTTAALVGLVEASDANIRQLAVQMLGRIPLRARDAAGTSAATAAATCLISVATGVDASLASDAIASLARAAWPASAEAGIRGALADIVRGTHDAKQRLLAAQGLVARRGDPAVHELIARLRASVTDQAVRDALVLATPP